MRQKEGVSAEEKIEIVRKCVKGKVGVHEVARSMGVGQTTMRDWVMRYRVEGAAGLPIKGNKRKAELMLHDILQEYEEKQDEPQWDTPFSEYVRYWLEKAKRKIDEVTYQGYEILVAGHVVP